MSGLMESLGVFMMIILGMVGTLLVLGILGKFVLMEKLL